MTTTAPHHPVRPTRPAPRSTLSRIGALGAVGVAVVLAVAGCGSDPGGASGPGAASDPALVGIPSPELPFPCSLVGAEEVSTFLGPAELDDVDRSGLTGFALGCTWVSADGTGPELLLRTDVSEQAMASVLEKGDAIDDLAGPAALIEAETVVGEDSPAVARHLYASVDDTRLELTVRAADPSVDEMVALLARVQARLAAASGPGAAEGTGLPAADLRICQDVVARWDRPYAVLTGDAQLVSSMSKYTSGLVDYAVERGPGIDDPELAAAYATLAAAAPADPSDPTPAEVTAIREAVEEVGTVCAAGGVRVDWLP